MLNPEDFRYKQIVQHAPSLLEKVNRNDDLNIEIINYKVIVDQSFRVGDRYRLPLTILNLPFSNLSPYRDINERGLLNQHVEHYFKKFYIRAPKINFNGSLAYVWCDRTETIVIGEITDFGHP